MTVAQPTVFPRFAGVCAVLSGVAAFLYAVSFFVISRSAPDAGALLGAFFLLLLGLLSTAAFVAVYHALRGVDAPFALWGLGLQLAGALGTAVHGGYDLAIAINPPAGAVAALPSAVDPRGLLTFGVAGLGLIAVSWLMGRGGGFPERLRYLGYLSGGLLVLLYAARFTVLVPTNPIIVVPALLNGFVVGPAWYLWLGLALRGQESRDPARTVA